MLATRYIAVYALYVFPGRATDVRRRAEDVRGVWPLPEVGVPGAGPAVSQRGHAGSHHRFHPRRAPPQVGLFVGYLTSQLHASVSQRRICSDSFTCCHTETEVTDQTFHLSQSQYTETGPISPSADLIMPGAWQGSHWSANFEVTGMTRPRKNPGASGIRTRDLALSRRTPYHKANEAVPPRVSGQVPLLLQSHSSHHHHHHLPVSSPHYPFPVSLLPSKRNKHANI